MENTTQTQLYIPQNSIIASSNISSFSISVYQPSYKHKLAMKYDVTHDYEEPGNFSEATE